LPENGQSLFFKGTLELLNQHYDSAIRLLEQAHAVPTEHPQTGLVFAIALFQRGQMFSTAERQQDSWKH